MSSYKDLEIYQDAFSFAVKIHHLSFKMPKFELYELGSQIRRSAQSVRANIVEGYGKRRYKQEYIRFLHIAYGSCLETNSHLKMIIELYPQIKEFETINEKYESLGAKLFKYIMFVEKNWKT